MVYTSHFVHVRNVHSCHIHRVNCGSVVVGVRGLLMQGPVAKDRAVFFSVTEEVFSYDHDSAPCGSKIFLSTHKNHSILIPSDWFSADIRRHISNDGHVLRNQVPREFFFIELKPVYSLVGAHIEERGILINLPVCSIDHLSTVVGLNVVRHNIYVTEFRNFVVALTGPQSGHEHVTFSGRLQRDQVLHDSGVLHSSTTLLKEYSVVVWYLKELSDLVFSRLRDVSKFVLSVRKFHNTLATAFVVEHFLLAFVEDSFRKNTRPS